MITRKAGPALAAGCTMVSKPASQTRRFPRWRCGTGPARREFPQAYLTSLPFGAGEEVGGELTSNLPVRKLSFTGSTEIGRQRYGTMRQRH